MVLRVCVNPLTATDTSSQRRRRVGTAPKAARKSRWVGVRIAFSVHLALPTLTCLRVLLSLHRFFIVRPSSLHSVCTGLPSPLRHPPIHGLPLLLGRLTPGLLRPRALALATPPASLLIHFPGHLPRREPHHLGLPPHPLESHAHGLPYPRSGVCVLLPRVVCYPGSAGAKG